MNLPNQLTIARLGITAIFSIAIEGEWYMARTTALLLFAAASITDYADGYIARRDNLVTDFGKLMDPLADKILMAAALFGLVAVDSFSAWVATAIISREFLVTGLRQIAAAKSIVLPAERIGKHKTIWQMVMILYFLVLKTAEEWAKYKIVPELAYRDFFEKWVGGVLVALSLILTVGSGVRYVWKNRHLIEDR